MNANDNDSLLTYALSDIEHSKVHGRTTAQRSPLTLFWTGSALELNVQGSELWVEVEAAYDLCEPWISVVINSAPVSRQMLTAGRYWLCIFRRMDGDAVKNVRIVRDVQAMSGDPGCSLRIYAVKLDGRLLPVEDKPYKIEFVGDSITSGEGAIGAAEEKDWIPMWFSAVRNYATLTAEALNADCRILSQSGWGVLNSWDNNPRANLPDYYDKVCGLLTGARNAALGAFEANDFASWQPDVVVVNLGTNDGASFRNPEWRDEATGERHKQRLNEDGSYNQEDLQAFEHAVGKFLKKLRRYNPHAHLVWAYGMLGIPLLPAIRRAVDAYAKESGDRKATVFQLPETTQETVGARNHPGGLAHERTAKELAGYLKGLLE